jgi:hypothetical protein
VQPDYTVKDHTGRSACIQCCLLDESGYLYLQADCALGLIHTQDMGLAADAVELGLWLPQAVIRLELPMQFNFIQSPKKLQKM